MDPHTQRAEAERWLGIAAKLMTARDFLGSKTFAMRAREADPNNPVSDQILAVIETILAGEKRVNASQQPDWYSILQLPRLARDPDQIADHYRRLVMCLNPERNRFPFADYALQLVMDAWSVLSDPTKKWLFDNELQMFSQQQHQQQPQPQQQQQADASAAAAAAAAGGGQLNTFQFFQQQPQQPQQQQQQPMWQLQQPQQQQHQHQHHHPQQQINQREFMPLPQVQPQSSPQQPPPPHQHQHLPPQWQMRDPTPIKSGGERNKQVLNGIGGGVTSSNIPTPMIPTQSAATATTMRPVAQAPPPAPPPVAQPQPQQQAPPLAAGVTVAAVGNVVAGNAGIVPTTANNDDDNNNNNANDNNNNDINDSNVNGVGEDNDEGVVEEGDCFWTACPYCFYIYEYQKVYQECTLRCQNCRKGFHAVQIPNPPPVSSNNGKEKEKEKGKGKENENEKEKKENAFCCWGFFPLGFSMTAWKKQQNQGGNMNGSNWVPFSPMFTSPVANGGGGFQWFDNGGGNAFVGPKHVGTKSTPRVYIDDDDEDVHELSESSDMDSSDGDWRSYNQDKTKSKTKGKKRRRRRGNVGGRRKGRPPKNDVVKQVTQNVASGGGVSVGGEELGDGAANAQEVVFSLAAGDKPNSSKTIPATLTRKQTRRSVKDVGRLDLNVEFNNDGEEHAPAVSAVNGEEDGIENIAFFEGLDEFLSTLPILNVGGDEKAKPS